MKKTQSIFKTLVAIVLLISISSCKNSEEKQDISHHQTSQNEGNYVEMLSEGTIKTDTMKGSPERYTMVLMKNTHIHISYHSPGVKDRVIWGGLVAYDKVWVSGAHNATTIDINQAIKIDGKVIDPSKYALFTIPSKDKWTVILNSDYNQHLADNYDSTKDVARFEVLPNWKNKFTPRLTYTIKKQNDSSGVLVLEWEKLKIALPFEEK